MEKTQVVQKMCESLSHIADNGNEMFSRKDLFEHFKSNGLPISRPVFHRLHFTALLESGAIVLVESPVYGKRKVRGRKPELFTVKNIDAERISERFKKLSENNYSRPTKERYKRYSGLKYEKERVLIKEYLKKNNISLTTMFPKKTVSSLCSITGRNERVVHDIVAAIRRMDNIIIQPSNEYKKTKNHMIEFHAACKERRMLRTMTQHEIAASDKIVDLLINVVPKGGGGLYTGTPTAICTPDGKSGSTLLQVDNLMVAEVFCRTLDRKEDLRIVIGNAIDPEKAIEKAKQFKGLNTTTNCRVFVGPVDRTSLTVEIAQLVEKYDIVKVVLQASGAYKQSNGQGGLDQNFEEPIMWMTNRYKNLHVMVMAYGHPGFEVRYYQNGNVTIY